MRSADPAARELLASVDASRCEVLWRLRLPSALPAILAAARYNVGLALAAAYYGEGGNLTTPGLGAAGRRATGQNAEVLWATILATVALGAVFLGVISVIERVALRWHVSQRRRRVDSVRVVRAARSNDPDGSSCSPLRRRCAGTHRPPRTSGGRAMRQRAPAHAHRRRRRRRSLRRRAMPAATTTPADAASDRRPTRRRPASRSPTTAARPTRPPARSRYLSGFDFAATASIVDVVVAEQAGYYDELCLDVELQPSFSTANYPIVAAGDAEFASGGSFSEVVDFATANDADLVAVDVEGRTAIDSLIVKPGTADRRSRISPARRSASRARSRRASPRCSPAPGSSRATTTRPCCSTASTRSPTTRSTASSASPATRATSRASSSGPGCRSTLFDPTEYDVPGSFGVLFTTPRVRRASTRRRRRTSCGRRCAASPTPSPIPTRRRRRRSTSSRPTATRASCPWRASRSAGRTDAELLAAETPDGTGMGVPDAERLQAEVDAYAEVGLFGGDGPRRRGVRPRRRRSTASTTTPAR